MIYIKQPKNNSKIRYKNNMLYHPNFMFENGKYFRLYYDVQVIQPLHFINTTISVNRNNDIFTNSGVTNG